MKYEGKIFFAFFCVIIAFYYQATADNYKVKYFTTEQGLAQDYVQNIIQDDRGFLWLGTNKGLSRFDGMQFGSFFPKDTLSGSYDISSSFKDSKGVIWFGLNNGSILNLSGRTPKLVNTDIPLKSSINGICEGGGAYWFASQTNGVLRIDTLGKKHLYSEIFKDLLVFSILVSGNDVLVGTNEGLLFFNYEKATGGLSINSSLNKIPFTKIQFLSKHKELIYVGTEDEGLFVLEITKGKINVVRQYSVEDGIASNDVQSAIVDKEGNLWIASFGKGISKIVFDDYSMNDFEVKLYNTSNGLKNDFIRDIIQDYEHNIWIATYGSGIAMLNEDISSHYFSNLNLRSTNIQTLIKDRRGNFWLGTDKGVSRISSNGDKEFNVINYTTAQGFPGDLVNALYEDIEGNIWIGTSNSGLFQFNLSENRVRRIQLSDDPLFRFVNSISGDKLGFVWVSTKGGAYRFGTNGFRLDYYTTLQGLLHNNVNKIFADSKNRIWMAAQNNRISYFKDSRFHYLETGSASEITTVNCMTEDGENNVWFGTDGKGIYVYDGQNAKHYTSENGLYSDFCYDIIADDYNNIWIGHRGGLSVFSKESKTFKHLVEAGLNDNINTNAVYKDNEGILWFGTSSGAVKYDPSLHVSSVFDNKVTITTLKLLNTPVEIEEKLKLPYKKYSARFEFVAVSFSRPEKILYKYKLEGYNSDWSEPSNTSYAYYPKLEEGNYKFMVLASNAEGVWNTTPEVFEFTIAKPLYKTWWFISLSIVLFVAAVYFVIRYRTYKLVHDKEQLEKLVRERTIEVVAQKEEIEKNRDEIQKNVNNITSSIKYAKRIQRAIFPADSDIKKLLPDSFVFFRPKSIVSGDFYWVEKRKDKVLFAAVDCTGHGVPGAFMSLVANNLLNQAVNEHGYVQPAKILDEVNSGLTDTLHQRYEESNVKDGMDIALCALDYDGMVLEYAGAYNSLFVVRGGELLETKANKFPIGVFVGEKLKKFTNHEIRLEKGDTIYIFSDGYADQFGGPRNKKFKKREFKNLLVKISLLPMNNQYEELDKTLKEWQGENEQLDDIVVIGVRV